MSLIASCSLYLPKIIPFYNCVRCYRQKCKLAPFNLAHPVGEDHSRSLETTPLVISRLIWRCILSWPWNVG